MNEQTRVRECCEGFSGERIGQAVDTFVASLESTFSGRGWPVVVRVDKETLAKLDLLVAGGVCKSRVDAAQYLIQQGIASSAATLARIVQVEGQIDGIKHDLADQVQTRQA